MVKFFLQEHLIGRVLVLLLHQQKLCKYLTLILQRNNKIQLFGILNKDDASQPLLDIGDVTKESGSALTLCCAFRLSIIAMNTCPFNFFTILVNTEAVRTIALQPVIFTIRSTPRNVQPWSWVLRCTKVSFLAISVIRLGYCRRKRGCYAI